ncbi:unnamed protein product [Caenorhabditis bovis]|uniref:Uncharacterized protein n=1 Tax=Caenorhabditis bovis TaxID=2654633 RepID=A0A8S1F6Z5_9PELO|nr:unnamed protein product [Caenorhabditis bovis]
MGLVAILTTFANTIGPILADFRFRVVREVGAVCVSDDGLATMMSFTVLVVLIVSLIERRAASVLQCQPPNNCSVHIFRVRLSQKPDLDDEEPENATIVSVVQRKKYGNNYFEIKGGSEMGERLTKEIIQNMPDNSDPRLMEKISKHEFYLKPVGPNEERILTATIPPPPPRKTPSPRPVPRTTDESSSFSLILVALLICIGIVLGILFTGICLMIADLRREPKFDRSNAVIYKKSSEARILVRPAERRPLVVANHNELIEMEPPTIHAPPSRTHITINRLAPRLRPEIRRQQSNSNSNSNR